MTNHNHIFYTVYAHAMLLNNKFGAWN